MIRGLIRYLVFFCVFLLSGLSPGLGYAHKGNPSFVSKPHHSNPAHATRAVLPHAVLSLPGSSGNAQNHDRTFLAEENQVEEKAGSTLKRHFKSGNFLTLYSHRFDFLSTYFKFPREFQEYFQSLSALKLYLVFEVFRI